MIASRMHSARAVQPTGEDIHALAPLIGLVRLHMVRANMARVAELYPGVVEALKEELFEMLLGGKTQQLKYALKLATYPLNEHPNSLVWDAIFELLNECFAKGPVEGWLDGLDTHDALAKLKTIYPTTMEVRDYVARPENKERFAALPIETTQWSGIWTQSGAEVMVPKAVRGKGKR